MHELLVSGGADTARVVAVPGWHPIATPDDWWSAALGSGLRATLDALDGGDREHVRRMTCAFVADEGIADVEVDVVSRVPASPAWSRTERVMSRVQASSREFAVRCVLAFLVLAVVVAAASPAAWAAAPSFGPQTPVGGSSTFSAGPLAVADVNADGHLDIVFGSLADVDLLLGKGDGTFGGTPATFSAPGTIVDSSRT